MHISPTEIAETRCNTGALIAFVNSIHTFSENIPSAQINAAKTSRASAGKTQGILDIFTICSSELHSDSGRFD
jgi:hypothetical protein